MKDDIEENDNPFKDKPEIKIKKDPIELMVDSQEKMAKQMERYADIVEKEEEIKSLPLGARAIVTTRLGPRPQCDWMECSVCKKWGPNDEYTKHMRKDHPDMCWDIEE